MVGRETDLRDLERVLAESARIEPLTVITGEGGVGKSRLVQLLMDEARRRGWTIAPGRAFSVETGVPYALLTDAFLPVLRTFEPAALTVLLRGTEKDLGRLFPALIKAGDRSDRGEDPGELKARLYWNFSEFLTRLSERAPVLIVLDDLHWADTSSIELIHFLSRQLDGETVRLLGTYTVEYREANEALMGMERSLLSLRRLRLQPLHPLDRGSTEELVTRTFNVSSAPVKDFADVLYGWTRGNPYFVEQTLEALVDSGRLYQRDGVWLGWEVRELDLPSTVRDAIRARLGGLSDDARRVAEVLAVAGGRLAQRVLADLAEPRDGTFADVADELLRPGLVAERAEGDEIILEFPHPLVRETNYRELSMTRARKIHGRIAVALERLYADSVDAHTDELAYHFSRSGGADAPRAIRYLAAAGASALLRHANQEAVGYLEAALKRRNEISPDIDPDAGDRVQLPDPLRLKADLAKAFGRLGRYDDAQRLWSELLAHGRDAKDKRAVARALRQRGLLYFWSGAHRDAIACYDEALGVLGAANASAAARLELAAGVAFQELGEPDAARERIGRALALAEVLGDVAVLARCHRALALLTTWIGEPQLARKHGERAIELAERAGDVHVAFWGWWALASLEGLFGDTRTMASHLARARQHAESLGSPVLMLWVSEIAVEYAYAKGELDDALAEGERAISLATALHQHAVLVRLMVWTATVYIVRGDFERARDLVERAWRHASPERPDRPGHIHAVVPAYIGRLALDMAEGRYEEAIETGEEGLTVADRSGYVIWVLHRLLPLLGESYIRAGDIDSGVRIGERLRDVGRKADHKLGLAWAQACDGIVAWKSGDSKRAVGLMKGAIEALERIPMIPDAARLRRQYAARLWETGDREGTFAELRSLHDLFTRLGAEPELLKTREMFRERGSRPPVRTDAEGAGGLSPRETEVALLWAEGKSTKAVARELDISPATVTTHVRNIYRKLEFSSRPELAEAVRRGLLSARPAPD